jgi:hypothetical protein
MQPKQLRKTLNFYFGAYAKCLNCGTEHKKTEMKKTTKGYICLNCRGD